MTNIKSPLPAGVDPCDVPSHGTKALQLGDARSRIAAAITPVAEEENVGIHAALGRVLARPMHSSVDVPSHRNSAMDGYALAAADLPLAGPTTLQLQGTTWAGRPYAGSVQPQ